MKIGIYGEEGRKIFSLINFGFSRRCDIFSGDVDGWDGTSRALHGRRVLATRRVNVDIASFPCHTSLSPFATANKTGKTTTNCAATTGACVYLSST